MRVGFSTVMTRVVVSSVGEAADEVVQVGDVGHHVVGSDQPRVPVLGEDRGGRLATEERA